MNCPVCGIPFIIVERNNIEVNFCPNCEGFWLDNGELELLTEILGIEKYIINPNNLAFIKSNEKTYNCPKCNKKMGKVRINDIILDVCPDGDGIWFDKGELAKVLSENKTNSEVINFLGEIFVK